MEIGPISPRPRVRLGHLVEQQKIDVIVSPELAGPALLDRIGDFNRARFLPVIERVLDEYDRPGELIRIDRLTLDLGRFEGGDLAGAEERLAGALRKALAEALALARERPEGAAWLADGPERMPLGLALVEVFEHYLLHGAWPYGAGMDLATAPAQCLEQLIADEPAALAAMLRRRGAADNVLRRLVRQMPGAQLRGLLHRLEPAHAAYVIAYLDDVRASHQVAPVVPATPAELDETLWTIVLRDALAQAGLQANRKAFLRRLLTQLAAAGGAPVSALVLQLRRGMRRVRPGRRQPGSLLTVLAELVTEDVGLLAEPLLMAELAGLLGRGPAPAAGRAGELRQLLALGLSRHRARSAGCFAGWRSRMPPASRAGSRGCCRSTPPSRCCLAARRRRRPRLAQAARTGAERAALLRRAAMQGRGGDKRDRAPTSLAALSRLLDGDGGDEGALVRALERARAEDAIALRRLLGDFAIADAGRLRLRMAAAMPASGLVAWLLRPHLAAALVALAQAASCGPGGLGCAAGGRRAGERIGAALVARTARLGGAAPAAPRISRADRRQADLLARRYAALDQAAALWETRAPFSAAERAHAVGRLLPLLSGVPSAALRRRLRAAAGGRGAMPDLVALAPSQLLRLALLLLAPAGEAGSGCVPCSGPPAQSAQAALVHALVEEGEVPAQPRAAPAPARLISPDARAALAATLRRLSTAALDRLIAALAAGAPVGRGEFAAACPAGKSRSLWRWSPVRSRGAKRRRSRPKGAVPRWRWRCCARASASAPLIRRGSPGPCAAWRAAIWRACWRCWRLAGAMPTAPPGAGCATHPTGRPLRALIAALISGIDIGPRPPAPERAGPRGEVALAAMLRTRPFAAIRLAAGNAPQALGEALPQLLAEPQAAPLLFAALAQPERERAIALGRVLTGRLGRAAIAPSKVARALALAVGAREWRGGAAGFAAQWFEALIGLASLSEQAALARLLGDRKGPGPPAAVAAKATRLRATLRDPHKRAALVDALSEGELVRVLARVAPGGATALLHAAERIAAARQAAGAGIERAGLWRALLAAATRDGGDVAPLAGLLLDGGEDVPAPPLRTRERTEQLLARSLEGARDAPLRAALDVRARARPPAPVAEVAHSRQTAADPGAFHIANAGLVLVAAYLPPLFRALDFLALEPSGRQGWKAPEFRDRAVHLLQWLVDGRCDAPEPQLALNKLLCGMHPSEPVAAAIAPTEPELDACRTLLATILANWPPLRSSTPEALRETFLQREGRLALGEEGWTLEVERKVLDILIDQLPWGFSTILHPWMTALITVRWG